MPQPTDFHPTLPEPINGHDPLCSLADGPCCPWMQDCTCQCSCEEILRIRLDQSARDNAWHSNPCMLCGPHAEYSTFICEPCAQRLQR